MHWKYFSRQQQIPHSGALRLFAKCESMFMCAVVRVHLFLPPFHTSESQNCALFSSSSLLSFCRCILREHYCIKWFSRIIYFPMKFLFILLPFLFPFCFTVIRSFSLPMRSRLFSFNLRFFSSVAVVCYYLPFSMSLFFVIATLLLLLLLLIRGTWNASLSSCITFSRSLVFIMCPLWKIAYLKTLNLFHIRGMICGFISYHNFKSIFIALHTISFSIALSKRNVAYVGNRKSNNFLKRKIEHSSTNNRF